MDRRLRWIVIVGATLALAGCTTVAAGDPASERASTAGPAGVAAPSTTTRSVSMAMPMGTMSMGGSGAAVGSIEIDAFDLGFKPSEAQVAVAGTYDVSFRNTGSVTHDLTFADGTKLTAEPGATAIGSVTIPADGPHVPVLRSPDTPQPA